MKKKTIITWICVLYISQICSCGTYDIPGSETSSVNDVATVSVETSESSAVVVPEETQQIVDYDVNSLDIRYTFDDILNNTMEELDIDPDTFDTENYDHTELSDCMFAYAWDYPTLLEEATRPRYDGMEYCPYEAEYHQTRKIRVNDIEINEFEDDNWARNHYIEMVTGLLDNNELEDSSYLDGYCFIYNDSNPNFAHFYACYYFSNCTIAFVYDFHNEQPSVYNDYLEFCDKYDLPVSNIMTQEVLDY